MENKITKGETYALFISDSPLYIEEHRLLNIVKNYPYFEINGNNQISFVESLKKFLNDNNHVQKTFIIINSDNINMDNQRKLSYMVKDKTYQNLYIPVSCKIIVIGNKEKMNKELLGLLSA